MKFRQLNRTLHLCLGLASGLVVIVLCVSGCLYAFESEFRDLFQPYRHVESRDSAMLPPSELQTIAERQLPGEAASRVIYDGPVRAARVQFGNLKTHNYQVVFINPYDGTVLKTVDMNTEFFHIVFSLHYRLWLPREIGTTIVDCSALVFIVVLASGLANWWPRSRAAIRRRIAVRWSGPRKRRNYDLHNAFGFYVFPIVLIIALTGLVWGFQWFNDSVYWVASAGELRPPVVNPISRKPATEHQSPHTTIDEAWRRLTLRHPTTETTIICLPPSDDASIRYIFNPDRGTYYKANHYYIDQYSGEELPVRHCWGMYRDANAATMLRRMNYDIHVGAIGGLPGKVVIFVATLLAASLPITGVLIRLGRPQKSRSPS